ncbi:hypothetical protein LA080_004734 [Diaporthe eres]|uniref:Uncharacterized protein n=1 Tax=Diaporthe vaccinii TaxID=105482 RepID=A0ABR4E9I0_9PEZI|nr:hypothetical protein LA080_004734 [Diaporthe eres]
MCALEFGHPICPSALELEARCSEGSDVSSSAGRESEQWGTTESIISHDGVSEITGKTEATTVDDDDDVDEPHFHDLVLSCDKQDQNLYDLHPRISPYEGLANIAPVIHFSGPPFGDGEVVDSPPGFTRLARVGTDRDQLPNELEQRVGPARHYHQLGICDATPEPVALQHPNLGQVNASWRRPEETTSEVREIIQQVEKSGLLQHAAAANHPQEFNATLHCTKSSPASAPLMAAVGKLKAVIGRFLAAMDEDELAAIGMLLAAIVGAHFGATEDNSPPMEAYWKASPSSSSTTRQTRMNEYPKGVIQRLMPRGDTIYFGMDMDSFARGNINPRFTRRIKDAAIEAAKGFRDQDLGIAFAYNPSREVFKHPLRPRIRPRYPRGCFLPQ